MAREPDGASDGSARGRSTAVASALDRDCPAPASDEQLTAYTCPQWHRDPDGWCVDERPHLVARSSAPASDEARQQGVIKCPSCGVRSLRCFIREAEIGSWCCGDCTAHHGQHEWNATANPPEELT